MAMDGGILRRIRGASKGNKKRSNRTHNPAKAVRPVGFESLEPRILLSLSVTDLTSLTALQLAQSLVGSGVAISNVSYTGANVAAGSFTGGLADGLGIDAGVILGTGNISLAAQKPNTDGNTGSMTGTNGDSDLDALIPGYSTNDASVLEFDFVPSQSTLSFSYVFASEEYNYYVNSNYNDVFGFFVNGQNIALLPGTTTPVSINNVNRGKSGVDTPDSTNHGTYYRNNENSNSSGSWQSAGPYATQYDGFTAVLQATATGLTPGVSSHIKLAIADAGDHSLDSAVFLAGGSFVSGQADVSIVKTASQSFVASGGAFSYTLTVANTSGTTPATGIIVNDILPSGINYVSASSSQGTTSVTNGTLIGSLGTLAAGTTATVTINVTANTSSTIINQATVTANEYDANSANNTSTVTVNSGSAVGSISGVKFNDLNGNGVRDSSMIQGSNPEVVFVIDFSGSTGSSFGGTAVGDLNGDGSANTILDAEIAGFTALNQQLITQGFGSTAKVAIVKFDSYASQLDMNPVTVDTQLYTTPLADADSNGVYDVVQILRSLTTGGSTNYEDALQKAQSTFSSLGTASGNGNLIFLSDGYPNTGGDYTDEVAAMKTAGYNLKAFGVGTSASLPSLQKIDPAAQIFTTTDQLLGVFSGVSGGGTTYSEAGIGGVTIYLDTNNNGSKNVGEPSTVTASDGSYSFTSLTPGAYHVREVVPSGYSKTTSDLLLDVVVVGGQTTTANVGNVQSSSGTISGMKFDDLDQDGVHDVDEPGLENWQIFLDENNDGLRDENETYVVTDADGNYTFENVEPGFYHVAEAIETNWYQTMPGTASAPQSYPVFVDNGQDVTGLEFGNYEYLGVENDGSGPDLVATSITPSITDVVVPSDKINFDFVVTNGGTADADGTVNIYFYASADVFLQTDQSKPDADTLIATQANQTLSLAVGAQKTYSLKNYAIPASAAPGGLTIFGKVEAVDNGGIEEIKIDNNAIGTDVDNRWRFGSWGARKNVKLAVKDSDGTDVTFTMKGAGYGELDGPSFAALGFYNTNMTSKATIATKAGTVAGTSIYNIFANNGDLGSLTASTTNLGHNVAAGGVIGSLLMGNAVNGGSVTIGTSSAAPVKGISVFFDRVADLSLTSGTPMASLAVTEWLDTGTADTINAPWISKLESRGDKKRLIDGNFAADVTLSSGSSPMTALTVNGLLDSAKIRTPGSITAVTLGAARDSLIFAGVDTSLTVQPTSDIVFTNKGAAIGSVTMKGTLKVDGTHSFVNTNIAADTLGKITLLRVKRDNGGPDYGLACEKCTSVNVTQPDGKKYAWTSKTNTWKPAFDSIDFVLRLL